MPPLRPPPGPPGSSVGMPPMGSPAAASAPNDRSEPEEVSTGTFIIRALAGLVIVGGLTWVALSLAPSEIKSNEVPVASPSPRASATPAPTPAPSPVDDGPEFAEELPDDGPPPPDGSLNRAADPVEPVATPTPRSVEVAPPPRATPRPSSPEPSGPFELTVTHRAVRNGAAGASTLVSVKVNGPRSTSVTLRSGPAGGPYASSALKSRGGGRWEGWLQFTGGPGDTLEYWIEADHPQATNTGRSGSRSEPHRVPLK